MSETSETWTRISYERTVRVLGEVHDERLRQDVKWGEQNHQPCDYLAILTEEVGEAAKECVEMRFNGKLFGGLRAELVQVAAVAVAFIECIDREKCFAAVANSTEKTI